MPRINPQGWIFAGIGGGQVSVWRPGESAAVVIATNAGQACVLDDNRCIFQHEAHLETFDTRTGAIDKVDDQGANELAAGGGVYAANFNGVVRASDGKTWLGHYIGDVGPDGTLLLVGPDGMFGGRVIRELQSHGGGSWSGLENYRPVQSPDLSVPHAVTGPTYGFRRMGDVCCYLAEDGRFIVQYVDRPLGHVLARTNNAFRPDIRIVGGAIIVTFAGNEGESPDSLQRFTVDRSQLVEPITDTAPVPVPTPTPVPHPTPEPVPMPFLPAHIKSIRDRYVARFPVPQGQGPEDFDPSTGGASGFFEDKARAWTKGLAEQIVFETGDGTWGVKNAGGGRPQSKDSIAQNGGRLINFDLLSGVGTGHPSLVPEPQGEDITGQTFMPVSGVNHLETPAPKPDPEPEPGPTPGPGPVTPPAGMDPELRSLLTEILASNKDQATQLKGLRSDVAKASKAIAALLVVRKK